MSSHLFTTFFLEYSSEIQLTAHIEIH